MSANEQATREHRSVRMDIRVIDTITRMAEHQNRSFGNMLEVPKLSNGEPANLFGAGYAGGLMLGEYRGLQTIGHGGADAGFRASVQWFPQYNTAVAVTTNLASGDPTGHLHKAVDVVLKEHFPEPPPTTDPVEEFVEVDKAILERYAGMFQVEGAGVVSFIVDEDKLKAEISGMSEAF